MSTTVDQVKPAALEGELSLELTKYFDAAPERVFDAWLGEEWGEWLPPMGATGRVTVLEPKPGGTFAVSMQMPGDRHIEISGRYLEIDRPHKLAMTWTGSYDGHRTLLTITLRPEGDGTLLTLRQEGFLEPQMQQGYIRGWSGEGGSFDKLTHLL